MMEIYGNYTFSINIEPRGGKWWWVILLHLTDKIHWSRGQRFHRCQTGEEKTLLLDTFYIYSVNCCSVVKACQHPWSLHWSPFSWIPVPLTLSHNASWMPPCKHWTYVIMSSPGPDVPRFIGEETVPLVSPLPVGEFAIWSESHDSSRSSWNKIKHMEYLWIY